MGKKKDKKKKDKKVKASRKPAKRKVVKKKAVNPYRVIVRDWGVTSKKHQSIELNAESKLEIHIDGDIYRVKIDAKNNCLDFDTLSHHLYLQPLTHKNFKIKAGKE